MWLNLLNAISPRRARRVEFDRLVKEGRACIGRHSYSVPKVRVFDHDTSTKLSIGSFCSIGPEVQVLLGGNHPTDRVTTFPIREKLKMVGAGEDGFPCSKGDVRVGNDVWIGFGAVIVSGAEIGDGAVVAAGSLVVGKIPPYSIVAGVPARVVRFRTSEANIKVLTALRWWDWPDEIIKARVGLLCDDDIDQAVSRLATEG